MIDGAIGFTIGVIFSLYICTSAIRRSLTNVIKENPGKTFTEEIDGEEYEIEIRKK